MSFSSTIYIQLGGAKTWSDLLLIISQWLDKRSSSRAALTSFHMDCHTENLPTMWKLALYGRAIGCPVNAGGNVELMFGQRRRRWPNINPTLVPVFAGSGTGFADAISLVSGDQYPWPRRVIIPAGLKLLNDHCTDGVWSSAGQSRPEMLACSRTSTFL